MSPIEAGSGHFAVWPNINENVAYHFNQYQYPINVIYTVVSLVPNGLYGIHELG